MSRHSAAGLKSLEQGFFRAISQGGSSDNARDYFSGIARELLGVATTTELGGGLAAEVAGLQRLISAGSEATFNFSEFYYNKLTQSGRLPAPTLAAREVYETATTVTRDVKPGYFKYSNGIMEMVYNPRTGYVWHIQQIK